MVFINHEFSIKAAMIQIFVLLRQAVFSPNSKNRDEINA